MIVHVCMYVYIALVGLLMFRMHTRTHMLVSNSPCRSTVIIFDIICFLDVWSVCVCHCVQYITHYIYTVCILYMYTVCMYHLSLFLQPLCPGMSSLRLATRVIISIYT